MSTTISLYQLNDIEFVREPKKISDETVVVSKSLYENLWDLLEYKLTPKFYAKLKGYIVVSTTAQLIKEIMKG